MKYANLGHTGLKVSRICLGCMSYGTPSWRPWVLDEAASQPFFQRAVEAGINFFDTANMYSLGVSEEVTGRALRKYARMEEVVLATKVYFPMTDGPNMGGLSRKNVVQSCEASLKRLGVETIDLYQIHRMDPETPLEETLAALDQLVRQGKVRYIGASSSAAWRFAKALSLSERNGWARFVSMQNHYNLVYREEEREMMPLCEAEGIGVIPWSPLARGLLAGTRKSLDDKQSTTRAGSDAFASALYDNPHDWDVVEAVKKVAAARGNTPAEVSLAWLHSKPAVVAPIIGATKMEHLEAAIRSVDVTLGADEVKALEAPYQPHAVRGM
ncbi:MAG TPA: aldo/keto reductase [Archangium sp.]|uniref:aldo/keto reductase n=1 Tax=Archangium sp. TaxID=1872627 RepID=UPI002E3119E6|nr:aldo/keto reductase [Archangium sp.]HEX5748902.1 aldo/keto reductase [Archangium sp.]